MKTQTFLIRADNGKEAVFRLPVGKYGSLTPTAFKTVRTRLNGGMKYALNLEALSNGRDIQEAIRRYYANKL